METRSVTQVRLFRICLNPMTERTESSRIACISDDLDKLKNWYNEQLNPGGSWEDPKPGGGRWMKRFKQGSLLEWYNPCSSLELGCVDHYGHGISDEWVLEDVYNNIKLSHSAWINR